ncbi:N-acetylglucosamine regulatory protein [Sphingobacterium faecium NBRC 15299]|uniref:ROK family protein n=1 Tax=Sphingobacterium faecium TaxID=34087 RepID=UPI000D3941C9|nr:ROK family protein [Sphingobacterium faecium]PTX09195.1 putative NBD/HSP70 family sugar kinase [Sphingobacterium faecium]GEM65211.1 N-acetylglucosamine regulatory protein [Sphingobacterium faecium NBRC 15299]
MNDQIIKAIYFQKLQSIAQLSKTFNKSIPLITKSVNSLLEMNLIEGNDLAASTGGRRAIQFKINNNLLKYTLVIALDQYYTSIYIFDLENNIIAENVDIYNPLKNKDKALDIIIGLTEALIISSNIRTSNFLGIGISMPGFVDTEKGINDSFDKQSKLYHIKKHISEHFNMPTIIENDSTCIAFAEQKFGAAKNIKSSLVINLNWGVGLGMIVNGQIFKGSSSYAGEFSHIPLSDSNELCSCGKKGCLEVEASLTAAVKNVQAALNAGEKSSLESEQQNNLLAQGDALLESAINGDQLAVANLGKIGYMLGKGIATLIHILNPEVIIISGRGAKAGTILMPQIQTAINEFCIPRLAQATQIRISETNKQAQSVGTAAFIIENLIQTLIKTN